MAETGKAMGTEVVSPLSIPSQHFAIILDLFAELCRDKDTVFEIFFTKYYDKLQPEFNFILNNGYSNNYSMLFSYHIHYKHLFTPNSGFRSFILTCTAGDILWIFNGNKYYLNGVDEYERILLAKNVLAGVKLGTESLRNQIRILASEKLNSDFVFEGVKIEKTDLPLNIFYYMHGRNLPFYFLLFRDYLKLSENISIRTVLNFFGMHHKKITYLNVFGSEEQREVVIERLYYRGLTVDEIVDIFDKFLMAEVQMSLTQWVNFIDNLDEYIDYPSVWVKSLL